MFRAHSFQRLHIPTQRLTLHASALLLGACALCVAGEPPEPGLRFYASFDKRDVTADYARGNPNSTTFKESLELRGVEGISGPGIQLAAGERLNYEMKGNFDIRRGSVSMWVQPVNWAGDVKRFHHFFVAQVPGVFNFLIYRYPQPTHLMFYIKLGKRVLIARTATDEWKPGKWYKIDCTWDDKAMRLYVNSQLECETLVPNDFVLPDRDDGFISISPVQFWKSCSSPDDRTIVDEVKVYDRVLSPAEIRREYLRLAGQSESGPAKPVDMMYAIDSRAKSVRIQVDALAMSKTAGANLHAQASLADAKGRIIAQKAVALKDAQAAFALPFGDIAPGRYGLAVEVTSADGQRRERVSAEFERPATPWLKPMPQYDHMVPDPWSPVEGDERSIRVWGRTYEFDSGPLPTAITSQGHAILAGPIQLRIEAGHGLKRPDWQPARVASQHPDALVRQGQGSAGNVIVSYTTSVEFDGMLRCDLQLSPQSAKAKVSALTLDVPIVRKHARFLHTHRLLPWKGEATAMDFHECVWLTGYRLGLCWFAESDANWTAPAGFKPIRLSASDRVTMLSVKLIASPVELSKPVQYTFGIQATPVRKLPANWRNLDLGGYGKVRGAKAQITAWGGGCLKQSAYLEPFRADIMRRSCKKWRDIGCPALPYSTPTYLSDHNPIFDFYHLEWRNTSGSKYVGYKHRDGFKYSMVATCPASDFAKLMAYWVENLSRDYDIGGIYFDCCAPDRCTNTLHGCGGTDAFGKRYATYPIFGLRSVLKRVFTILHSRGKILVNHAHSRFYPPCHAFSDYWYPGEQFTARLGRDIWFYTDELPLEVWQVELSARTKGVGISFLPEYGRGTDKKYRDEQTKPSRSLLACCVVHDVPVCAAWINLGELQKVWDVYDKFALSSARFWPYWEPHCPASVDAPLLASVYQSPNALVVMVSNLKPKPHKGTLRINASAMGVPQGCVVRDEQTGQLIQAPPDQIPIDLPERDFAMLSLTWPQPAAK